MDYKEMNERVMDLEDGAVNLIRAAKSGKADAAVVEQLEKMRSAISGVLNFLWLEGYVEYED